MEVVGRMSDEGIFWARVLPDTAAIATDIPTCMPYEGRLRLHYDSVYMYDSASLYAQLAGLLCHDPPNTAAVDACY